MCLFEYQRLLEQSLPTPFPGSSAGALPQRLHTQHARNEQDHLNRQLDIRLKVLNHSRKKTGGNTIVTTLTTPGSADTEVD